MQVSVDLWCIDLVGAPPPGADALALLGADERSRHGGYLTPDAAVAFATTRIALRRLLARRLGREPAGLRIEPGRHGKPFAIDAPQAFFNVSHCRTTALIAFCDAQVGVDVEDRAEESFDEPLATVLCSASEARWMRDDPARAALALRALWTRKEAVLKAVGIGLSVPLSELDLGDPAATRGLARVPGHGRTAWRGIDLGARTVAALAVAGENVETIEVNSFTSGVEAS